MVEVRELEGVQRYLERIAECFGSRRKSEEEAVRYGLELLRVGSYRVENGHGVEDLCNGLLCELPSVISIFDAFTRREITKKDTLDALLEIEKAYQLYTSKLTVHSHEMVH